MLFCLYSLLCAFFDPCLGLFLTRYCVFLYFVFLVLNNASCLSRVQHLSSSHRHLQSVLHDPGHSVCHLLLREGPRLLAPACWDVLCFCRSDGARRRKLLRLYRLTFQISACFLLLQSLLFGKDIVLMQLIYVLQSWF